jgi:CopG antitoxin of type II toxin-antitoxin system
MQHGRQVYLMSERTYKGPKYPNEAHGSIPAFNSYEEEAIFWDTHDFTDFKQETETAKIKEQPPR